MMIYCKVMTNVIIIIVVFLLTLLIVLKFSFVSVLQFNIAIKTTIL